MRYLGWSQRGLDGFYRGDSSERGIQNEMRASVLCTSQPTHAIPRACSGVFCGFQIEKL